MISLKKIAIFLVLGFMVAAEPLFCSQGEVEPVVSQREAAAEKADQLTPEIEAAQALVAGLTQKQEAENQVGNSMAGVQALLRLLRAGADTQKRMLAALPDDLRQKIEKFFLQYSDFVAKVHAPHAMYSLGLELQKNIGVEAKEGESAAFLAFRKELKDFLDAVQAGLVGSLFDEMNKKHKSDIRQMLGDVFAGMVLGGASQSMHKKDNGLDADEVDDAVVYYDAEDLQNFSAIMTSIEVEFSAAYAAQIDTFSTFKGYLAAVTAENIHQLALVSFAYLEPIYLSIAKELLAIQVRLFELFEESLGLPKQENGVVFSEREATENAMQKLEQYLEQEDGQVLYGNNPYYYCLTMLKRYEGSCTTYAFMKRRFNTKELPKDFFQFFKLFAYAYNFSTQCLDIYYDEVKTEARIAGRSSSWFDKNRLMPTLLNYALTSSVAANYFFQVQNVARNTMYYDALLTKGSVGDIRMQMRAFVAEYIGIAAALPTLMGSPLTSAGEISGSFTKGFSASGRLSAKTGKLAASWIYYAIFYHGLFNRNEFFRGPGRGDAGVFSFWPTDFKPFRKALLSTVDESAYFFSLIAESICYNKLNPDFIEDVDAASCGIINPGAIRYVVRAFMPMMLMGPAGRFLKLNAQHLELHYGLESQANAAAKGMSPAGLYAEQVMVDYVLDTVGYNAGYWVGKKAHKQILSGLGYTFKGICNIGEAFGFEIADQKDMLHVLKFAVLQLVESGIEYVKMFLWPTPEFEQISEPLLRGLLIDQGYLNIDHDKVAYREAIVNMALTRLARVGVLEYYDAAIYSREFKNAPTMATVDLICRKVCDGLNKHLVSMGTGRAFAALVDYLGNLGYQAYGPVTPKVRNLFK